MRDHLIAKVEKMEGKIYSFGDNITQLLNDTNIDMTAFSIVSRVVVKNRKQVEDLFPFLNYTKEFLQDSKKCIETYDICPHMRNLYNILYIYYIYISRPTHTPRSYFFSFLFFSFLFHFRFEMKHLT